MAFDIQWPTFWTGAEKVLAVGAGAAATHLLERRPRLICFYGHSAAVEIKPPGSEPVMVHTHSVVVRNSGRKASFNLRLGHNFLPDFSVFPSIQYSVLDLAGGGKELLFPTLVGGEQITVQYLYYPPLLYGQINTHIKSDEGLAKVLRVLPTAQVPNWIRNLAVILMLIGVSASAYALFEIGSRLTALYR